VSSAILERAAQSQKAPPKLTLAKGRVKDDVRISLMPPTCRLMTTCFQLVRSACVATSPSPQDFETQTDGEGISVQGFYSGTSLYYTYATH